MGLFGVSGNVLIRLIARMVHIITSIMMLTILILECFFYLDRHSIQENANFKRLMSSSGMLMIGSGIVLTTLMRRNAALPT